MTFDHWLHTVCFQKPTPEAFDLALSAWNYQQDRLNVAIDLLNRYYTETPLGHQPHMIAHKTSEFLGQTK